MTRKTNSKPVAKTQEEDSTDLATCFAILNGVQDQIKFADRKAAFFSALNALMFGFASQSIGVLRTTPVATGWLFNVSIVVVVLYALLATVAVALIVSAVMSRYGALAPTSKVFFGHIIKTYGKDYGKYVADMTAMTNDEWAADVGTQIVEVSHIALTKHKLLSLAAKLTLGAFVLWAVALGLLAFLPS